jgi:hypothetical protein
MKKRGRSCQGSKHGQAKLTLNDVTAIRSRAREPLAVLAAEFGVSQETVSAILLNKIWQHGNGEPS